ncbi:hypothetical protein L1887_39269 [Cichorium endivia]|nr:hypothetical protein L1887_39269 [Cichorium endivia]
MVSSEIVQLWEGGEKKACLPNNYPNRFKYNVRIQKSDHKILATNVDFVQITEQFLAIWSLMSRKHHKVLIEN